MSTFGLIIAAVGASALWRDISPRLDGWTLLVVGGVLFSESAAKRIVDAVRRMDGGVQNKASGRRQALPPLRMYLGKTDAAHAKNASGTISLWGGAIGSETDTGINVTAYNHFGDLAITKKVFVIHNGHGWLLVSGEC